MVEDELRCCAFQTDLVLSLYWRRPSRADTFFYSEVPTSRYLKNNVMTQAINQNVKRDGLRGRTVNRLCFRRKSAFRKMLSVTLTFEPLTLKMSSVSRGPIVLQTEQW